MPAVVGFFIMAEPILVKKLRYLGVGWPPRFRLAVEDGAVVYAYGVDDFVFHSRDGEVVARGFDGGGDSLDVSYCDVILLTGQKNC